MLPASPCLEPTAAELAELEEENSRDNAIIDRLLRCVEKGEVAADWGGLDPQLFWIWRLIPDLVSAYYAHPSAWSAMGFSGPASPRGYVRMDANQRDPWEAAERGDDNLLPASFRNRHAG